MREIKFRAWNGKQMFYRVVGSSYEDGPCSIVWMENKKWVNHDGDISQYTGLKDKNGKEIYEGDILTDGDTDVKVLYSKKYGAYIVVQLDDEEDENTLVDFLCYDDTMIIGNIYENKELLEEK